MGAGVPCDGNSGFISNMIHYLRHNQIDKIRWDQTLETSSNRRIYGFSWYLDRVCPGWDALVLDDYRAVFPLTWNRKYGISYLYQPFFTQQSGPFSADIPDAGLTERFIAAIPVSFRFIEIHLNSGVRLDNGNIKLNQRINHELSLTDPYDTIAEGFSKNARRNLKKAALSGIAVGKEPETEQLIRLFADHYGKQEGKLKEHHYRILRELIMEMKTRGMAWLKGVWSVNGELQAAACVVSDAGRLYFLFAGSAPVARETGAMFMLIDHLIREHAGKSMVLDFEGGNDPIPGRFYKSFGALEVPYQLLKINKLPAPIRWSFSFYRKLRQS
jgi:hypothetical protein